MLTSYAVIFTESLDLNINSEKLLGPLSWIFSQYKYICIAKICKRGNVIK